MDELEQLLAEEEKETPAPSSEVKPQEADKPDEEVLKKEQHLANINKALAEAQEELKRIRKEKVKLKSASVEEEDELPKIDMDDPSAKAWNRHILEQVNPVRSELEQEKAEIRQFALQEFLSDKPSLISKPEKVKELVATYERIRTASERTKEGVLLDLEKAYAATFHKELLEVARNRRVEQAKADTLFSDIAVSKGATAYASKEDTSVEKLSEDDRKILAKWNMSPQQWQEQKKKYK